MDEMTLLKEFRAAVAPPGEAMLAQARAGMIDGGAPGQNHPRRRRPHLRGTRGRFALTGLVAHELRTEHVVHALEAVAPERRAEERIAA